MRRDRLIEAASAVEAAGAALQDAERRAPEAAALKRKLARMRQENHFAISWEASLRAGYERGTRGGRH